MSEQFDMTPDSERQDATIYRWSIRGKLARRRRRLRMIRHKRYMKWGIVAGLLIGAALAAGLWAIVWGW